MYEVKHGKDHRLKVATAKSRKETKWKNKETSWPAFIEKLSETYRTRETVAEYAQMKKDDQDAIKDIGGFVGGYLKDGRRKNGYVTQRSMITLDADFATPGLWDEIEMIAGYAMVCYSTHKHTPQKPRLRIVIPLAKTISPEEYEAIARKIAEDIGIDYFDDTTYEPTRLMYWPSTSKDGEYFFRVVDAPILEPDKILSLYDDWKDTSSWPESSRVQKLRQKSADKQGDPLTKPGLIGAFCRTYTIHEAIEKFLDEVYVPTNTENRYTYQKGSTSAGLVVYDDKFAYSNHGTDPAGGQLCNAFDLVRIHLFGEDDLDAKPDTPVNKLPSWQKMNDLIKNDAETKKTIGQEHLVAAKSDFAEDTEEAESEVEADLEWMTKLETKKDGTYLNTIDNILLILRNDPLLQGLGAYNEFNDKYEVKRKLPWKRSDIYWTDVDDASLRHYLEKVYNLDGRQRILDALVIAFQDNAYHPVKRYLQGLEWDGTKRLETIFCDYLGASNTHYVRTVTRKTLTAAVARIYNPGCKFDYMLTLVGAQGIGKSYILYKLGGEWFSDTMTDIRGKEAYEALDGVWIMEIGELAALKKAERESIKNYISKQSDTYRKAFARNTSVNKRQCIFIGTTNDTEFLNDSTGSRRYWIVDTNAKNRTKTIWNDMTQDVIDQIWAEAKHYYETGENIMELDEESDNYLAALHESHTEQNPYLGAIMEFLEKPIPKKWDAMKISSRVAWFSGSADFEDEITPDKLIKRNQISAMEVWVECFQKDQASLTRMQSRIINEALDRVPGWIKDSTPCRYGPYGNQRGYKRADKPMDDLPF